MKHKISAVIPLMNEEESIPELYSSLKKVLEEISSSHEIVFVDDGSTDTSLRLLKELAQKDSSVKIYSFRKNLGKSHALTLGFQKATGDIIVTLDADLQDDPENIKDLYKTLVDEDFDMITGWRKDRKDSPVKIISSTLFNSLISTLFNIRIRDLNCGLKIYKSEAAKELKLYGGLHRFIPLLVSEMGYKVGEQAVTHHPRKYGVSKYKFTKIFTDIPDLATIYFITKYNRRPLHFFGKIGSILFVVGFLVLLYLSYIWFLGEPIGRRPLLLFGILLVISGIQIVMTGLIADLIVNLIPKHNDKLPIKFTTEE